MTLDNEQIMRCENAAQINHDNLMKIISDNKNTRYGKEHNFNGINDVAEYRRSVSLSTYSCYEGYINRMRKGEEDLLTVYPIVGFCRTSGSTGRSKYIPLSSLALEKYEDYFERWRTDYLHSIGGRRFLINAFRSDLDKPPAREALFSEYYFRSMYEKGFMDMKEYIGGEKMIFVRSEFDIMYAKIREAFCYEDIRLLECQFMYELLGFFDYIEKNWRSILQDIVSHTVPEDIILPVEISEYLNSLSPSAERIHEIQEECEKGFEGIAKRLWKQLSLISGVSNRSYLTENSVLDKYISGIPRHHLCYCASECYIGTPYDIDSYEYVMMPQNAFFEFLPYRSGDGKTLLPHELEIGKLYEPVITNFSGLYRYKMSDVVKISGYVGESPRMEFMFRKSQALNVAGEKFDMRQLEKAVYDLRDDGIYAENYCMAVCVDKMPRKYLAVLAVNNCSYTDRQVAELLDRSLRKNNSEYDDLRDIGALDYPVIMMTDTRGFARFMSAIGSSHKYGHNKPKHLFNREVHEDTWRNIWIKTK